MVERESLFHPDWAIVKRPEIALIIIFASFVVASLLFQVESSTLPIMELVKSPALMNLVMLGALGLLAQQVRQEGRSRREAEYLRLKSDFSGVTRALIRAGRHEDVYNELASRTRRRFIGWQGYSRPEKVTYLYMEQVYELLERVFDMREKGWVDEEEWELWARWIDDLAYHPLFSHVYEDGREMHPRAFEEYVRSRLLVVGPGKLTGDRGQDENPLLDRDRLHRRGAFDERDR